VHHMIDLVDPSEEFTVAHFAEAGRAIIESTTVPLVITGGSGLHFRALVDPMSFAPPEPDIRAAVQAHTFDELRSRLLAVGPAAASHADLANARRMVRALEIDELAGATPAARASSAEAGMLRSYEARYEFRGFGIAPGDELDSRIQ